VLTEADRAMLGEAQEYLRSTAERVQREARQLLPGRSVSVTWSAVWSPDVAHTIVSIAQAGRSGEGGAEQTNALAPSDLIAIATHGHGGLRRWMMGSVADRVLQATTLPLLVVRSARPARPPESDQQ
jgi:nucleotide-binding universal stress UspA family protein